MDINMTGYAPHILLALGPAKPCPALIQTICNVNKTNNINKNK